MTWLRDHMGIVSQEPVLFATSIADNIRLGKLFITVITDSIDMPCISLRWVCLILWVII